MTRLLAWPGAALIFLCFYVKEVVVSNFKVARDVLSPSPRFKPGLVAVPVGGLTERQRLMLAVFLTMTPGTISVDIDAESGSLWLHTLYTPGDPDELRKAIKHDYEPAIQRLF
ncbi:Na+/H+ antiporter subunit E [Nibricoccus sp. IMCC34717]|uniref:Na+/H+ antiporter subunit E n=1 Tax=Nibricoccus sp. IMCC34717 TaxID=3034021 RepID=UPI00384CAD67